MDLLGKYKDIYGLKLCHITVLFESVFNNLDEKGRGSKQNRIF